MAVIIQLSEYGSEKEIWAIGAWCVKELGYLPEAQTSRIAQVFKLRSAEDAMAFKLRWL